MNFMLKHGVHEEIDHFNEKEMIIFDWLNDHYKPMDVEGHDDFGMPKKDFAMCLLDTNHQLTNKLVTPEMVFYQLQSQFKKILPDHKDRNVFLWNTLNKWFFAK